MFVSAYELLRRFPDGVVGVLHDLGGVDCGGVASYEELAQRVKVAREGFGVVQFLGLVNS